MNSKKILVVEHDRLVAEDIAECLRKRNYDICGIATSGRKAKELARVHEPDMALIDIDLQGEITGLELAATLKNDFGIASVYLSSSPGKFTLEDYPEPAGFLSKPVDSKNLIATVKTAFARSFVDHQVMESEEWFLTTLNSIEDGVITTDLEGRIRFLNESAEKLTGRETSESENEPIDSICKILNADHTESIPNPVFRAIEENKTQQCPDGFLVRDSDESTIAITHTSEPIHNSTSDIIGAVLIIRDVTAKKDAERKTFEYQEELEKTVEVRTEALLNRIALERLNNELASQLLVTDTEEFNNEMNQAIAQVSEFLDLSAAGVVQRNGEKSGDAITLACFPDTEEPDKTAWFSVGGRLVVNSIDDLDDQNEEVLAILESIAKRSLVTLPLNKEGSTLIYFASDKDRQWSDHEIVGLKSVATVISHALERKRIEEQRKLLQDQLHQSQKLEAIGKLTGGIAHDFNNMLVPIIGYADSILEEGKDIPWKEEITEIRRAASSAASLTRQLLAFSRKQILDKKPLHLNDEIEDMERMIQRMIGEDIILKIETSAENDVIEADRGQFQQIIVNLCVNARDAMPEGGEITISTKNSGRDHSGIIVTVSDTGVGMPKEVQEQAFDPFFSTKGINGTGLGLSVVLGIVHQHQGKIGLTSEESVGTSFAITFPVLCEAKTTEIPPAIRRGSYPLDELFRTIQQVLNQSTEEIDTVELAR